MTRPAPAPGRLLPAPGRPFSGPALGRLLIVLVTAAVTVLGAGGPAVAHAGGLTATDARSRVLTVTPAVPGLTITAIEDGARLRLRNNTGGPITINPGGGTATPATVTPGTERTWIDDRTTPDGRSVPAGTTIGWSITLDAGGTPVTVTGELVGERRPPALLWWIGTALTGVLVVLAARRLRRADLLLATAGTLAAAASVAHVAGSTLAVESAPPAGTFLSAAGINLLAWPLIAGGAVTALRGRPAGLLAVCAGAALTAVFVLPDVTSFHRPVVPFAGPADLERVLVSLALALGAAVAVAGARVLRDLARQAGAGPTAPGPTVTTGPTAGTEPAAAPPAAAEPGTADPAEPAAVERGLAEPAAVERGPAEPAAVERGPAESAAAELTVAEPAVAVGSESAAAGGPATGSVVEHGPGPTGEQVR